MYFFPAANIISQLVIASIIINTISNFITIRAENFRMVDIGINA